MEKYVPLIQTFLWAGLISFCIYIFWDQIQLLKGVISKRLKGEGFIKLGPIEIGEIVKEQKRQANELDWVQSLAKLLVSDYERQHLDYFNGSEPFNGEVKPGSTFDWELRHLLTLNFIQRHHGKGMRSLFRSGKCNLKDHLFITERGRTYLNLLKRNNRG